MWFEFPALRMLLLQCCGQAEWSLNNVIDKIFLSFYEITIEFKRIILFIFAVFGSEVRRSIDFYRDYIALQMLHSDLVRLCALQGQSFLYDIANDV